LHIASGALAWRCLLQHTKGKRLGRREAEHEDEDEEEEEEETKDMHSTTPHHDTPSRHHRITSINNHDHDPDTNDL